MFWLVSACPSDFQNDMHKVGNLCVNDVAVHSCEGYVCIPTVCIYETTDHSVTSMYDIRATHAYLQTSQVHLGLLLYILS